MAGGFWAALPPALRDVIAATWDEQVEGARAEAAIAQDAARRRLIDNGVAMVTPSPEVLAVERARLMAVQSAVVATMGIDPELVKQVTAILARG